MKLGELLRRVQGDVRIDEWIPGADLLNLSEPYIRDLYIGDAETVPAELLQREICFIHGGLTDGQKGMVNIQLREKTSGEGGTT